MDDTRAKPLVWRTAIALAVSAAMLHPVFTLLVRRSPMLWHTGFLRVRVPDFVFCPLRIAEGRGQIVSKDLSVFGCDFL